MLQVLPYNSVIITGWASWLQRAGDIDEVAE